MDLQSYVIDKALILVPVLYIIGSFLKKTPVIKDWCIPWILLAVGIGCAIGLLGFNEKAILQGILITGTTVMGHQLMKQTANKS